jgi:hypothetical protein
MFTLDEMRMKTAFTPFTLDESSAMHIQSAKCKFALTPNMLGPAIEQVGHVQEISDAHSGAEFIPSGM